MSLLKIDGEWKIVSKSFYAKLLDEVEKVNFKSADKEKPAIEATLKNYLKGQATGNPEFLRQAFYKDARIIAFRGNKISNLSSEEFAGFFKSKIADDEAKRNRWIESLDISGNAATAKIILDYPTIKFNDYMSLLKIDGEWKIVNKSFYAEPKQPKQK